METVDDIRDIAIRCVDKLVNDKLIKDCTDTDDESEFQVQDTIFEEILRVRTFELYFGGDISEEGEEIIRESVNTGAIQPDEPWESFCDYAKGLGLTVSEDFRLHYQNLLNHHTNLTLYINDFILN